MGKIYIVSDFPDKISQPVGADSTDPPHYQTPDDAFDAIKANEHGEFGRLYVLEVQLSVVAIADRGWELTRHPRHGAS